MERHTLTRNATTEAAPSGQPNGFALHGIGHLSPSSLNHFLGCPGSWIAERLLKRKAPAGPAMHRGIVVEDAVAAVLGHGQAVEDAKKAALADFGKRCAMLLGDTTAERDNIPGMIDQALAALDGYGVPIEPPEGFRQHKVSLRCGLDDGSAIEFIGYLDLAFGGNRKVIVDLKTTTRCPSRQSFAHQVQRCIYQKAAADGWGVEFVYATPKKHAVLADGNTDDILAAVKAIANRMNRFLKLSPDPMELASFVPVNVDSFYWSDPAMKQVRRELYGL
jgi:hypothetical protein